MKKSCRWKRHKKIDERGNHDLIAVIEGLIAELLDLGYPRPEVDYMVASWAGTTRLSELTEEELRSLERRVRAQLALAQQSIAFVRDGNEGKL